jgi:sec-independent protein translocase protein TatC
MELASWRAVPVRPVAHDQQLSLVEHLDELRTRLIVCLATLGVAFGICVWQNHALLTLVDHPLAAQTQKQVRAGKGPLGATYAVQVQARQVATDLQQVVSSLRAPHSGVSAATAAALANVQPSLNRAVRGLSRAPSGDRPVTLGIGEPFTQTLTVSFLFALVLSLPLLLFQLYAFLLPGLDPPYQRAVRPLVAAVPVLFVAGAAFGYEVVLPAALHFFQNFNSDQFNVLVQAGQYYHFAAVVLLAMGLVFQVPVAVLAVTRAGVVAPRTLRRHRRYAVLACGVVAAMLPGDAITLLLETVPLYLLYESSVLLASLDERRRARRSAAASA